MKLYPEVSVLEERAGVLETLALAAVQGGLPGASGAGRGTLKAEEEFPGKAGETGKAKHLRRRSGPRPLPPSKLCSLSLHQAGCWQERVSSTFTGFLDERLAEGLRTEREKSSGN